MSPQPPPSCPHRPDTAASVPAGAPISSPPGPRVRQTQVLAVTSLLGLVVLCLGWEWTWAPLPGGTGALVIKSIPLILALPGLLRLRLYTFRWLSLLVWVYVAEGLVRGTSDAGLSATLAWAEVVLGTLLFVACALHVRARLQAGRALPPSASSSSTEPQHATPSAHA